MSLFLTIFEGVTPSDARPLIAINDPEIIATVRDMLVKRLGKERRPSPMAEQTVCVKCEDFDQANPFHIRPPCLGLKCHNFLDGCTCPDCLARDKLADILQSPPQRQHRQGEEDEQKKSNDHRAVSHAVI